MLKPSSRLTLTDTNLGSATVPLRRSPNSPQPTLVQPNRTLPLRPAPRRQSATLVLCPPPKPDRKDDGNTTCDRKDDGSKDDRGRIRYAFLNGIFERSFDESPLTSLRGILYPISRKNIVKKFYLVLYKR